MNPLIYLLGEITYLCGFLSSPLLLPRILIFSMFITLPFLFFKKTCNWITFIFILFIVSGWVYGLNVAGLFYLNFYQSDFSHPRILAFAILFAYLLIFASTPLIIFKVLQKNKWKYVLFIVPFLFIYIGLYTNDFFF